MSKIEAKRYKAQAVQGSFQYGLSSKGNEQIAIDLLLDSGHTVTTFLNFSEASKPFSEDRLVALGWEGSGTPLEEARLCNEVEAVISYREYNGKEQMSVDILTGSGRAKLKQTMDEAQKKAFLARLTGVAPVAGKPLPF